MKDENTSNNIFKTFRLAVDSNNVDVYICFVSVSI